LCSPRILHQEQFPIIAHLRNDLQQGHYVVVLDYNNEYVTLIDPSRARVDTLPAAVFVRAWSGHLLRRRVSRKPLGDLWAWCASSCVLAVGVFGLIRSRIMRCLSSTRSVQIALVTAIGAVASSGLLYGCQKASAVTAHKARAPLKAQNSSQIIAFNPKESVGLLGFGQRGIARFVIQNTGDHSVRLEFGQPSCNCTQLDVSDECVPHGGRAHIGMELTNHGVVGPFRSVLNIAAPGEGWSEQLVVEAFGLGLKLVSPTCSLHTDEPGLYLGRLKGRLYTSERDSVISAIVEVDPQFICCKNGASPNGQQR